MMMGIVFGVEQDRGSPRKTEEERGGARRVEVEEGKVANCAET
jgi:hypothetical protein